MQGSVLKMSAILKEVNAVGLAAAACDFPLNMYWLSVSY